MKVNKVILQPGDSGSLYRQAMAAARALADEEPDDESGWRIYEIGSPTEIHVYVVKYNKASITVWPQTPQERP